MSLTVSSNQARRGHKFCTTMRARFDLIEAGSEIHPVE
ncbi:hypothetical protein BRUCa_3215 [Brucella melitensis]|nr:hypothetical protein BM28_B1055 [Brucella melitensis M28]ADZ89168.1 hypothetical protein BM590_B1051 [Brucella melitensis M5-90]AEW16050.1 hypothetical protein BCA52141_II1403 [Brucella canis HSK A52141]AIB19764.1 Hypothetical protein BSSP3_II1080 [Brucella suis bv. 2]AIB23136.1 Hypothetical protein BSPT1_II1066 [Brucella suis bv. 2]